MALERYDYAYDQDISYVVCPECEFKFILAGESRLRVSGLDALTGPGSDALQHDVECSTHHKPQAGLTEPSI